MDIVLLSIGSNVESLWFVRVKKEKGKVESLFSDVWLRFSVTSKDGIWIVSKWSTLLEKLGGTESNCRIVFIVKKTREKQSAMFVKNFVFCSQVEDINKQSKTLFKTQKLFYLYVSFEHFFK